MKKKNLFISLVIVLILCIMISSKICENSLTISALEIKPVQVEDNVSENESQCKLKLNFDKERSFDADFVEIRYNLTTKCDTISCCLNSIKSQINELKEKLKDVDDKIEIESQYYSCHPELNEGVMKQKCNYELKIKTNLTDRINDIIEKCDDLKINSYYGIEYKLNDENSAKSIVLKQAIEEAREKVKNISNDLTLVKVKEGYSYAYSENEKVVVKVNITCEFE